MGTKLQYALIYGWVKLHALLPMGVLYFLSDIFYLLIYHVARYRLRVVRRNLAASFPGKTEKELRKLERGFYRHFADYVVETMKLAHISLDEIKRRAVIENPELIDKLMAEGHTCILLLMGHFGNWEWYSGSTTYFEDSRIYQIYRPLNNKAFDELFIHLRTRFASYLIKKNDTVRDVIRLKQEKTRSVVIFIADQTPSRANLHFWTDFLHQDTPFLTGPERMARKLDLPVVFLDVKPVRRGYYTLTMELLTKRPKETPEFWITEQYARMMERMILRHPAGWLWTHKRWKHKRDTK